VQFAILGPLEAHADGVALVLGGPKQRAVLALLLLHANEVVSRDALVDGLWGETPPAAASRTIESYVSRLRALVGADRIERRAPGYRLRVESGELDVERFEDLVRKASEAAPRSAEPLLREALGLWRGAPLADLTYEPFAGEWVRRLEERRGSALERLFDVELELGKDAELVADLERSLAEDPYRERLIAQLMISLYRAGRHADSLAVYQAARRRFVEDLGLEPSPSLQDLERAILVHDRSLGQVKPSTSPPRPSRRWILAVGLGVCAVLAVAIVYTERRSSEPQAIHSAGIVELSDPTGHLASTVQLDDGPVAAVADGHSIWLAQPNAGAVLRFDTRTRQIVQRIPVSGGPTALAIGGGSVWAVNVSGRMVLRIDPRTETVTERIGLGGAQGSSLAYGAGYVWVGDPTDDALLALNPRSGAVSRTKQLDVSPATIAFGRGRLWVADYGGGTISDIDPTSLQTVATTRVGNGPSSIAIGPDAVWTANSLDSTVSKLDPATDSVTATLAVGSGPSGLTLLHGKLWVANQYSSSVSRIDSDRGAFVANSTVGAIPTTITAAAGAVWVGVRADQRRHGGTLVLLHQRPLTLDPALQLDVGPFQSDGLTRDGLVTYDHTGGAQSLQLVPDLAVSIPAATHNGTTYTFRLRAGINYSTGMPVRAEDFRRGIERVFRLDSAGRQYFSDIIGASACRASRCSLSRGIVVSDAARTVTFHLTHPDPNFLSNLTLGALATPVPHSAPFRPMTFRPIPGTGPYQVASANRHEIEYVRNPRFREWSHAAQPDGSPDKIVMRFGLTPLEELRRVEAGRADWTADGIPTSALPGVETRFASQLHTFPGLGTTFLQLNTSLPPFNDQTVRRAFNLAVDRAELVRRLGGTTVAAPTCQILPPGVLGYKHYCPFRTDLVRARRIVRTSGTAGTTVTVWGAKDDPVVQVVAPYAVHVLRQMGFRARPHLVPSSYFDKASPDVFKSIQLTPPEWIDNSPYNFFNVWFACAAPYNHHWFCDPAVDRAIARAASVQAVDPPAAARLWARLDRELVDRGAWVPLVNPRTDDFVSRRVQNYLYSFAGGVLADQLSLVATK
jgi:YVTN family beta-propeller protein